MKKIGNGILLLLLMLGSILNITPLVGAETVSTSAIQFVDQVTLSNSNGPITSNKISDASSVNTTYRLSIPNGTVIDTSQIYTLPLPQELKYTEATPIQLTKEDGTLLGSVTIQNNVLNIVFEPIINNLSNRTLFFNFWSAFNKNLLNYDVGNDLAFPTKNNPNNTIHVNFSKSSSGEGSGSSAIAKTLHYEANNVVSWTITINNGGYNVSDAIFTDTMSNTQDYIPGSTRIYYRNYKNTVIKTETTDLAFNSNLDGSQSATINFGRLYGDTQASLTETNSIVIHYQTKLKFNPLNNKYPNHAYSYDGDMLIDSAVSTATYHSQGGGGTGDAAGDITVQYVDASGNKLADDVILSGNIGATYTSEQKEFEGYNFKEVQGNPTGSFTEDAQTITYIYSKIPVKVGTVTVEYIDESGNKLADDVTLSGNIGATYTSEQKEFGGYSLKEVQGNPTGSFTEDAQTITYIYSKIPVKVGTVTVEYIDESGNKLADDVTLSGNIGATYTSEQKEFEGYNFKEVQGNPTGSFTEDAQTITYIYNKIPVKGETVTIKYTDDEGKNIVEDTILTGNVGEEYVTVPKKISGYSIKGVQGNPKGFFTTTKQEVKYLYVKSQSQEAQLPATGEDNGKFLALIGVILLFLIGGVVFFVKKINKYK